MESLMILSVWPAQFNRFTYQFAAKKSKFFSGIAWFWSRLNTWLLILGGYYLFIYLLIHLYIYLARIYDDYFSVNIPAP